MVRKLRVSVLFFLLLMVFSSMHPSLSNANTMNDKASIIKVETSDGSKLGFGTSVILPNSDVSRVKDLKITENRIGKIEENTLEQKITFDSSLSNFTIEVPLELQNGEYIVLEKDDHGNSDGAAIIYNNKNESIGIISSPILENVENFNIVSVNIKNVDTLEFQIESDGFNKSTSMLITLAATSFYDYFTFGGWVYRGTELSLQLIPKSYLFSGTNNDRYIKVADSWNKVYERYSGSNFWTNTSGLADQYSCHYTFASKEPDWHIEPWRPDVGLAATVKAECNPK